MEGAGTRYKHGNLEGTPIVEDGVMYVTDGWGTVYAIDVTSGKKGAFKWRMDPKTDKAWPVMVAWLRRQQSWRGALEGQGDLDHARWPADCHQQGNRRGRLGAQDRRSGDRETLTAAPLIVRDVAIVGTPVASRHPRLY